MQNKSKDKPTYYTISDIKAYWNRYQTISGYRYLSKGKWHYDFTGSRLSQIDATRAEVTLLCKHISFPTFLEKYGKDKA